jgi:hypothetical protein
MAIAFAGATGILVTAAFARALMPSPAVSTAVATLLLAVAAAHVLSRTSGIPVFTEHPEPFDPRCVHLLPGGGRGDRGLAATHQRRHR